VAYADRKPRVDDQSEVLELVRELTGRLNHLVERTPG
jgi:hypothetical protein